MTLSRSPSYSLKLKGNLLALEESRIHSQQRGMEKISVRGLIRVFVKEGVKVWDLHTG